MCGVMNLSRPAFIPGLLLIRLVDHQPSLTQHASFERKDVAQKIVCASFRNQSLSRFVIEHHQRLISIPEQRRRNIATDVNSRPNYAQCLSKETLHAR